MLDAAHLAQRLHRGRRPPGDFDQDLIAQDAPAGPVPSLGFVLAPRRDLSQHAAGARAQPFPSSDALVAKPGVTRLMVGERLNPAKLLFRPLQAAKSLESPDQMVDRKSTRLNSSHGYISYAV